MKRTESSLMLTQSLDVSTVRSHVAWSEVQRRVLGFEDDVFGEQVSAFCLQLVHLGSVLHFTALGWHRNCCSLST
jgi:hypothetical protein